jgi:excisionase family DNA binding protein
VVLKGCTTWRFRTTDVNDLLDIGEAARFLNVSATSLRRWTNAGVLECLRIGKRRERRFRRAALLAFMEQPTVAQRSAGATGRSPANRDSAAESHAVSHGSHLCAIYGNEAGRISLCVPFLLDGLRERSICVLIASAASREKILENLKELRPRLSSDIKEGRLICAVYERSCSTQWKSLEKHLNKAQKAGGTSFRAVGDVIGMRSQISAGELIEYEAGLDDRIMAKYPVAALCLYDARKFPGSELLNALKAHRDTFRYPLGRLLA